jgi:transposase
MKRIIYVGIDVHSTNFTFCALEPVFGGCDRVFGNTQMKPGYQSVIRYINNLNATLSDEAEIICGYEAGCLGYTLMRQLKDKGIRCQILAPSTMSVQKGKRRKSDRRDAEIIARNMANNDCSYVYVPTRDDEQVKDYIRMRDDHKGALKKVKQQILAFCLRHGQRYSGKSNWTIAHLTWLRKLELDPLDTEILHEYLQTYEYMVNKIEQLDVRIDDLASMDAYEDKVKKLRCFLGIETRTALALVTETGDFERFRKGNLYAAYLGLIPGEDSSGDDINHQRISKAGNVHLRKLLTEAAQSICKGQVGHKSKALKARQNGNDSAVIAYADRANERLRRKYYRMIQRGKTRNVAVTAVSRELACFVWGMMTDNTPRALA